MLRKAWNTNLRISLVLMVAATFGATAWADGTHGSTFTVKNDRGGKILVYTFKGDDSVCAVAHKEYVIGNGGERTAKCHGNGTHRCKFRVYASSTVSDHAITDREQHGGCGQHVVNVNKGETCTMTGRYSGDYNCQ